MAGFFGLVPLRDSDSRAMLGHRDDTQHNCHVRCRASHILQCFRFAKCEAGGDSLPQYGKRTKTSDMGWAVF